MADVRLLPGATPADGWQRNFYATSSCGVCGKAALDAVRLSTRFPPDTDPVRVTPAMLSGLPDEQVDTLIAQLKINKEFGFLKSDVWDNPDRIRKEFFHRT